MDKYQATHYILKHLRQGADKIEIAADLCERLNAPPEMVLKFVEQVAASFTPPPPPIPKETPPEALPSSVYPFALDDRPVEVYEFEPVYAESPERSSPEISEYDPTPNYASQGGGQDQLPKLEEIEFDAEALTQYVVQLLKKHRRHNDIVEYVANKTGWHWNESQRFVARTQTQRHGELTQSQNRFMIPLSIAFILGGLLLLGWSILALLDYYLAYTGRGNSALAVDFVPLVIGSLFTSFGIIAGGIFGLYRTLSSR